MPAYTPYLAEATRTIGGAMQSRNLRQQQAIQKKMAGDAYMGDPEALRELMQLNPAMGMKLMDHIKKRKDAQAQKDLQTQTRQAAKTKALQTEYKGVMDNIAKFETFEEAQEYGNSRIADLSQRYPEALRQVDADMVFTESDFNLAKQLSKSTETGGMFSAKTELLAGGGTRSVDPATGIEQVTNALGEIVTGQDAADVLERSAQIKADIKDADVDRLVDKQRRIEQVKDAIATADEAFIMVDKLRLNNINLAEVIPLIGQGANTGPIMSLLPSFFAETIRLQQLQKRLGLDVVGSVRFGALSKGELDLALAVALPLKLKGDALIKWANDKIAANKKLMAYLEKQAIFLGSGHTQDEWLKKIEAKELGAETSKQDKGNVMQFDAQGNLVE